jgi:ABC-2 type transport system ATP-binding protein
MYDPAVHPTNTATAGGITAAGLGKRFGDLWALRGLDLEVRPGQVLGLLGHNGAGKTTAIRILTTLSEPTEGSATVAGFDVVRSPGAVRSRIGVASQQNTVDDLLNARMNLEMVGRLYHLPKAIARARADELLELLDLTEAGDRLVKTFSGGMRRRLDLAASLVARPEVLFLDEPTTGLDPRSRNDLWSMLRELSTDGTTIVLTTQYLEEADRLADDIVVLDHGRVVAQGTPSDLKARIGNDRLDVTVADVADLVPAAAALSSYAANDPTFDEDARIVSVALAEGIRLIDVVRSLDEAGIDAADLNRRQASLDDVFLTLTSPHQRSVAEETPA